MSWFDASSFTSYAKTALASAQKSIDKVLDIDEGVDSTKNKNAKDKESTDPASISTQKKTGLKLQASKSQSKSNTSEKESSKTNSSVDGDGDFWSSFLGTSSPSSSSAPASSDKKPKMLSSSKQNDSKVEKQKPDIKGEVKEGELGKRRQNKNKNRTNNTNGVSEKKDENKKKSDKEDKTIFKKETDANDDNGKIDNANEMGISDSLQQEQQYKSHVLEDCKGSLVAPSDGLLNKEKGKDVSSLSEEQEVSLLKEKNEGNICEISKQGDDIKKGEDRTRSEFQEKETEIKYDYDNTEDIGEVKDDGKESSSLSPETSESLSDTESSENVDIVSRNIESLLAAPTATSTPHTRKVKGSGDDSLGRISKSLFTGGKTSRIQEQKEVRKEPVEDECDTGEDVITGSVYAVDENMQDEEGNLENSGTTVVMEAEGLSIKPLKEGEGNEIHPANIHVDSRDTQEEKLEVPGELTLDSKASVQEKKICVLSEQSLEVEMVSVQEHKTDEPDSIQVQTLLKEVSSLRELVDARESKMVALSKENIDLQETNAILRSQLEQLENVHNDDEEFEGMKEEFVTRIAATENKFHEVTKERDDLKRELEETTKHFTTLIERKKEELTTQISEKDEQIEQLLTEGEKLSKQELQSNTIIKKLRAKEKENDTLIKKQTKKLEEKENEIKELKENLKSCEDSNLKQKDTIFQLDTYVKKQEEQLRNLTSELEDANEKVRSTQVAIDNAYKELTSLQKQAASSDSSIQEAVLSTEMKAKEELRIALEKTRREYGQDSELMALQIADLQTSLSRAEKQATRREESLREEIKDLQQRIQEAEDRNQDLAASVSQATRPLLRQIDNLQATHSGQASTLEMVEKNLTERLKETQSQLLTAQEKERLASQNVSELNSRIARLESQVSSYRTERARLEAELELERNKAGSLEDSLSRDAAKSEAVIKKYKKLIEEANLDKAHLEQQLAVEKSRLETELKKVKATLENKEKQLSRQSSLSNVPPPSPSADSEPNQDDEVMELKSHLRKTSSSSSVVDGFARGFYGGTTELVERLQAQLRQKDGEIKLLQDEVTSLRKSRDSVMEELTKMTSELHELETSHEQLLLLKAKHDELEQRYNAVLQMYGEKEEEAEELRMDLHDIKSMYKQQLEQLFGSR